MCDRVRRKVKRHVGTNGCGQIGDGLGEGHKGGTCRVRVRPNWACRGRECGP